MENITFFNLPGRVCSTAEIRRIAAESKTPYTVLLLKPNIEWVLYAQERMAALLEDTGAGMVYADHFNKTVHENGEWTATQAPVIDYQMGALRDDFEFGSVLFFRTEALKEAVERMKTDYEFAGLYDLRLKVSQKWALEHISEYLYYDVELDNRKSGEKIFDYVDPKNRGVQIEMEKAVTEHLKEIGGYLEPKFKDVDMKEG
ncbi:MAG: glycosyltransferase family 2 protein, partial [Bacteroidales bacterium]|nr:glycosyltransferase family 2 protein [Candidatus Colicola coprequi]